LCQLCNVSKEARQEPAAHLLAPKHKPWSGERTTHGGIAGKKSQGNETNVPQKLLTTHRERHERAKERGSQMGEDERGNDGRTQDNGKKG